MSRRARILFAFVASLYLALPVFAQEDAGQSDADLPHDFKLTPELAQQWYPVDPRALTTPDPHMRWLAEQLAAGSTDTRILRAYHRLYPRHFPFTTAPPADLLLRGVESMEALREIPSLGAAPPVDGCWTPLGPRNIPGRMTALALHPTDAQTIFTGGADGGIWKTTDLGATWTPLSDFEPSLTVGAMAIDPIDASIIYVGTGEANYAGDNYAGIGVMKSIDGGGTWTLTAMGANRFHELIIDPRDRTKLWGVTRQGLFLSTDSAQTWAIVAGGLPGEDVQSLVISGKPGSTVMLAGMGRAATAANRTLYRSTDSGTNWTPVAGFPTGGGLGRLVITQSGGNFDRMYAAIEDRSNGRVLGIYLSDDEGVSWTQVAQPGNTCNTYCWYCLVIAADAADPDLVYVGGVSIYRSTDAGQNWSRINSVGANTYAHVDQHQFFSPAADVLWIANDGGIYHTLDRGATIEYTGFALETAQYYHFTTDPLDDAYAMGGTQDNGTHKFRGNLSWDHILGGDGAYTAIDWNDNRVWYASSQGLNMSRSRARGAGMQRIGGGIASGDPRNFIAPFALDRSDPTNMFACTNRLWKSTDQGDNFIDISPVLSPSNRNISAVDNCRDSGDSIWVGTNDGLVWHTADGGTNWNDVSAGLPGRYVTSIAAHPARPEMAYVSVSGNGAGHIWQTVDSGLNWTDVSNGLPNVSFNTVLITYDQTTTLLAAADLGVYRSDDEGATWVVYGTSLPNVAVDWISYSPVTGTVRAGTHGRGAWQLIPDNTCPLFPEFSGLEAITVDASTGCEVTLTWQAALSNCAIAPGLSYNIYRSQDPMFVPDASALLVAGYQGTSYVDLDARAGQPYYYLVRAEDGQTGGSGPANGGKEDPNAIVLRADLGDPAALGQVDDDGGDSHAWLNGGGWSVKNLANTTPGGRFSYHSAPRDSDFHLGGQCASLTTPDFEIGSAATLTYQASYNLEEEWDGVIVQISIDGGQNWSDLPPDSGYPSTLAQTQGNGCGFGASTAIFSGPAGNAAPTAFAPYTSDLSGFTGQTARIRWVLTSDGGLEFEGFYLDDISIAPVLPKPAASPLGNVLLGVKEAGDPRFTWQDNGASLYRLRHDLNRMFEQSDSAGTAPSGRPGVLDGTPRTAPIHHYRVSGLEECIEGP